MEISIRIVDDHPLFRKAIKTILSSDNMFTKIEESSNGKELIESLEIFVPDVILLDASMPDMNGLETLKYLKINFPCIKIIILTSQEDEQTIWNMVKNGARGYIFKSIEPEELINIIKIVCTEGYYYCKNVQNKIENAEKNRLAFNHTQEYELNEREIKYIQLLSKGYNHNEISDIMCLSIRTIDGYRERLCEKIEVNNRIQLVLYALKKGLIHF